MKLAGTSQRSLLVLAIGVVNLFVATKVGDDREVAAATSVIAGIRCKTNVSLINASCRLSKEVTYASRPCDYTCASAENWVG